MKFLTGLACGVLGMAMASALDITTQDGTVYRSVKLKMAGDEEVKVCHSEGENVIKLDVIRPFDLKTADGRIIQGALLNGIRKSSIVIEQDGAVRSLRSEQLSPEICGVFGFSSGKPETKKTPDIATDKSLNLAKSGSESASAEKSVKPVPPANQMSAAGKIFLEKLKKTPEPSASPEYGITSANIHKSIVFIRGGGGSGSGFICNLRGIPVIITNAHVYAALPNPAIMDSDRREYQVKSALACKTRDLVILEIDLPAGVIPLELDPRVTNLALNSGLAAYGDSLGDGVVTDLKGILQGIGPGVIEISAGIVPGNSGGPVVGEKLRVIGVSTFLKRTSLSQNIFDGTRFGNKDAKKDAKEEGVRRFATRVDNMDLNDFEIIDPELKQKDLDACHALQEANNSLIQNIRGYKNSFEALMFFMKTYVPLDSVWNYRCSLSFLDDMFKHEIEKARFISVMAGLPMNNASAAERAQAQDAFQSMQSYRKSEITCPRCHGAGIIRITDSRNLMAQTEKRTCDTCQGNPKRNFIIYNLYNAFLSGKVKSSSLDFSGLFPGCSDQTAEALLKSLGVPFKMDYCGAISVWQYNGNNIFPEAKATQLFFVGGRLESIMIVFDNSPAIWKKVQEQISRKYGKFDWDINHGNWHNCGIRQKGFSIDMRYADIGVPRIVIICQHDMLSYLKYLVLNDVGRNITANAQE